MLNLSIINNVTHSSHKPPLYPFLSKSVSLGFEYIKQPFSGPFDLFCPFWGDIIPLKVILGQKTCTSSKSTK